MGLWIESQICCSLDEKASVVDEGNIDPISHRHETLCSHEKVRIYSNRRENAAFS